MSTKIVVVGLTYKLVLVDLDSWKNRLHPPPNLLELDAEFLGIRCQIQSKMTPNKNSILTAEIISNSLVFSPT